MDKAICQVTWVNLTKVPFELQMFYHFDSWIGHKIEVNPKEKLFVNFSQYLANLMTNEKSQNVWLIGGYCRCVLGKSSCNYRR